MRTIPRTPAYGICLGASTITAVEVDRRQDRFSSELEVVRVVRKPHEGNPKDAFREVVRDLDLDGAPVLVTGRKFRHFVNGESITEPEATEYAVSHLGLVGEYDAVVSAGGETFMVYALDSDGKINGISTGNKCASGTGEFFLQQIRRMDLRLEEAVSLAHEGRPYAVSGRCSVFCKSDCTHALNKGEPIENVTAGLCRMIANKIAEIVDKVPHNRLLVVGGTALNTAVTAHLESHVARLDVPEEASYFEALGAAVAAVHRGCPLGNELFREGEESFAFLDPLASYQDLVTFSDIDRGVARDGDRCIVGLDVGSTTTKAVLLRVHDHALLASVYLRTNGSPITASRACFQGILDQLDGIDVEIEGLGVTGSGRQIAGLYALTEGVINEIIAHAAAAVYFDPEVDTIFEIGGQDAKYTYITNGVASDYAMNEACSAGTGSFLEEAAWESLGVPMTEIADAALLADRPPNFNDQCAAFISSDIKNATHEGISQENILAGLVYSICLNYVNRVKGARPVGRKVFLQGGVCYNRAVPLAMAGVLGKEIVVPPEPGLMGAFGVALEVEKRLALGLLESRSFDLSAIVAREVGYRDPFVCPGGPEKCDLKCRITRIEIEDKVYPFGGACNRYYNLRYSIRADSAQRDFVAVRNNLMFETFGPEAPATDAAVGDGGPRRRTFTGDSPGRRSADGPRTAPIRVGLSRSFITMRLYPLYSTFFSRLGCEIVLPDEVDPDAAKHLVTSMCYPVEVAIGLFEDLVKKRPDYIFLPHVRELYVPGGINRVDYCSTCAFSRGEAFILKQAFRGSEAAGRVLAPTVSFNGGWENGRDPFVQIAVTLGFDETDGRAAFDLAIAKQHAFEAEAGRTGRSVLDEIHADPSRTAVVVFGRPYNAYAPEANKGIPRKLTSRGQYIIPYEMLPYDDEPLDEEYATSMHWESGQRILRAAQIVERDPQLFGLFITNFLCAPDSFIVQYFRSVMGRKPSLTLELDAHTADAGINTRIEAFLDIVRNYREVQARSVGTAGAPRVSADAGEGTAAGEAAGVGGRAVTGAYRLAHVRYENSGAYYVDSGGVRMRLTDPRVKVLIPSLGRFGSDSMAAAFRRIGIRAQAVPPSDRESLRLGRGATSGKECLPHIVCLGGLLKYLKEREAEEADERVAIMLPKASGYCRLGQYHVHARQFIRRRRMRNVAVLDLAMEENYGGLGPGFTLWGWRSVIITDAMDDIELAIRALARNPESALQVYREESEKIWAALDGSSGVHWIRQLKRTVARFARIPRKQPLEETARVAIVGEYYVRRDPFSNLGIANRLADRGFAVTMASLSELVYYTNYLMRLGLKEPNHTLQTRLEFLLLDTAGRLIERRIKRLFARSGFYRMEIVDAEELIKHAEPIIPKENDGEQGLVAGTTMRDGLHEFAGIVNVGPFGCMQIRFADAVTAPQATVEGKKQVLREIGSDQDLSAFRDDERIPFLSVESDGNPYPQLLEARFESFCLAAERAAGKMGQRLAPATEAGAKNADRAAEEDRRFLTKV